MRFAIATIDRYLGIFEAFVFAGWTPVKLFTCPSRSELDSQKAVITYAEKNGAAIQLSRLTEPDFLNLREQGCEALIVASYNWKIGDWAPFLNYAVNFHSSPLPEGRGSYPAIQAILEGRKSWAVTCHKLAAELDSGDILAAETFPMQPDECHESLDLKIQMAGKKLAQKVAGRFAPLWEGARPQSGGSYWQRKRVHDRVIDFNQPVEKILRHVRAYGSSESLAFVNGWLLVKRALGWTELHNHAPGAVVHIFNSTVVVAVPDGYIALLEWGFAPAEIVAEIQAVASQAVASQAVAS